MSRTQTAHPLRGTLLILFCLLSAPACGKSPLHNAGGAPVRAAYLRVENMGWQDVTVYLQNGGKPIRLASVPSLRSTRLMIPAAYVTGTSAITIRLEQIGEKEEYVLPAITVFPGAVVALRVARLLEHSTYAVLDTRRF